MPRFVPRALRGQSAGDRGAPARRAGRTGGTGQASRKKEQPGTPADPAGTKVNGRAGTKPRPRPAEPAGRPAEVPAHVGAPAGADTGQTGTEEAGRPAPKRRPSPRRRPSPHRTPEPTEETGEEAGEDETAGDETAGDGTKAPAKAPATTSAKAPVKAPARPTGGGRQGAGNAKRREAKRRKREQIRRRRVRRLRRFTLLALVLLLIGGTGAAVLVPMAVRNSDTRAARSDGLAAANAAAPVLLSYDYRTFDTNVGKALGYTTGSFTKQYKSSTHDLKTQAVKLHAVVTASVSSSGVVSATPEKVTVLMFVDEIRQNANISGSKQDQNRVVMTLVRTGGHWRVSQVNAY